MIPFMQNFGKGKTIWMENRSVVAKGWLGEDGTDHKGATKVNFQGVRNVLYGTVMVDT